MTRSLDLARTRLAGRTPGQSRADTLLLRQRPLGRDAPNSLRAPLRPNQPQIDRHLADAQKSLDAAKLERTRVDALIAAKVQESRAYIAQHGMDKVWKNRYNEALKALSRAQERALQHVISAQRTYNSVKAYSEGRTPSPMSQANTALSQAANERRAAEASREQTQTLAAYKVQRERIAQRNKEIQAQNIKIARQNFQNYKDWIAANKESGYAQQEYDKLKRKENAFTTDTRGDTVLVPTGGSSGFVDKAPTKAAKAAGRYFYEAAKAAGLTAVHLVKGTTRGVAKVQMYPAQLAGQAVGVRSPYNYTRIEGNPILDKDVQMASTTAAFAAVPASVGGWIGKGITGYAGYQFAKEPTPQRAGELVFVAALPTVTERTVNIINRNVAFAKNIKTLESKYGKNSPEVKDFTAVWNRAFKELPRDVPVDKPWTSANVKSISELPKVQRIAATKITDKAIRANTGDVNIIGSTTILPQTRGLTQLRRGKSGDIDVPKGTQELARQIFEQQKKAGIKVNYGENYWKPGESVKYHVNIGENEFLNMAKDANPYTYAQIRKHMGFTDITPFAWSKDPYGVKMLNARDQMRAKLWAATQEAKVLTPAEAEAAIASGAQGRAKDLLDAWDFKEGTDYLFTQKGGIRIKPSLKKKILNLNENIKGYSKEKVQQVKRLKDLVQKGKLPTTEEYGYYPSKYGVIRANYKTSTKYKKAPYGRRTPYSDVPYLPKTTPYAPQAPYPKVTYATIPYKGVNIYIPKNITNYRQPYTPVTSLPYTTKYESERNVRKKEGKMLLTTTHQTNEGYQPILQSPSGKTRLGDIFRTPEDAAKAAMHELTASPGSKFTIRKVQRPQLRYAPSIQSNIGRMYRQSGANQYQKRETLFTRPEKKFGKNSRLWDVLR